jgi:hypothetical protein
MKDEEMGISRARSRFVVVDPSREVTTAFKPVFAQLEENFYHMFSLAGTLSLVVVYAVRDDDN